MEPDSKLNLRTVMLLALLLWLVFSLIGCAQPPTRPVKPPAIPDLPAEALQPPPPTWCQPTCSAGLTRYYESWLLRMTKPASPVKPASTSTTP